MKNTAKGVYEALQKEFGDKFEITLQEPRKGKGIVIIAKLLNGEDSVLVRIMEESSKRFEPYFRIYISELEKYFNDLGEAIGDLDLTHLDFNFPYFIYYFGIIWCFNS